MSSAAGPFLARRCPACAGGNWVPSWRKSSAPPGETAAFSELKSSWRGFFKQQKLFFTYRRCESCSLVYAPTYFTSGQLAELYQLMDDNTAGVSAGVLERTQRGYFDLFRTLAPVPENGGYLELGPDIGLFTREAVRETGLNHYWLVEPNLAVHAALQDVLGDREHTLLSDEADLEQIPDESLSMAVAIHVIDHLLDPRVLLERLHRKLKSGGVIFLVLHNERSLVARLFGRRWPPYCLQHPQIFAPASVTDILYRSGFQDVQVRATINHFPAMYLLRHFLFGIGLRHVPLPDLPWLTVGLKLGNIAVVGRKA